MRCAARPAAACGRAVRIMRVNTPTQRAVRPARPFSSQPAPSPSAPPPPPSAAPGAAPRAGLTAPSDPFVGGGKTRPRPATSLTANINFVNNLKKMETHDLVRDALKEFRVLVSSVRSRSVRSCRPEATRMPVMPVGI